MENIDLCEIGIRISNLRKQRNLTQEQLSEMMDVSVQMISNLERGNKAIKIDNLVKISKILNASTDYILTGAHTENDLSDTASKLDLLSKEDYAMIEHLIEYCANKHNTEQRNNEKQMKI